MPISPPRPCSYPGCPEVILKGRYCPKHLKEAAVLPEHQKRADPFYVSTRWKKLTRWYKNQQPLCEHCQRVPAQMVHHREPIKAGGDPMAIDNLEALCNYCHNRMHKKRKGLNGWEA